MNKEEGMQTEDIEPKSQLLCSDRSISNQCEICNKSFTRKWSLKNHIATVHGEKRSAECEICSKILVTNQALKIHIATVHEETI